MRTIRRAFSMALVTLCMTAAGASDAQETVFELGKLNDVVTVIGETSDSDLTDSTVTIEDVWTFNRNTLDEAIKLVPGVTSTLDGTARRNERGIYVRGFGRWQVPLSIDGIRIYLPADNRLDFNRFLTQDLSEIEVQKGYVSVLDGPGGMGGAINLITRKPAEPFETEFRIGAGEGVEDAYLHIGSLHESFYVQGSVSYLDREYWNLSDDFVPTAIENGGERDGSDNRDSRANVKIGFTPNDGDEYSLSYTAQTGEKGAPLHVLNDPPNPPNSYWRWPTWDIGNLYWLSVTRFGAADDVTLKTTLFDNTYENSLYAYDNATYTTQSLPGRFQSFYDDSGYGGSVEVELPLGERNTFGAAYHQRRDEHTEYNDNRPTNPAFRSIEPVQATLEDTWSLAVENTFAATSDLDLVAGLSYEENELELAQEFNAIAGLFEYPTGGSDATNVQGAAYWRYAEGRELRGVISSRTRFPTIFERFSTRFGTALPNPRPRARAGRQLRARLVDAARRWSAPDGGAVLRRHRGHDSDNRRERAVRRRSRRRKTSATANSTARSSESARVSRSDGVSQRTTRISSARSRIHCSPASRSREPRMMRPSSRSSTRRRIDGRSRRASSSRAIAGAKSRAAVMSGSAITRC